MGPRRAVLLDIDGVMRPLRGDEQELGEEWAPEACAALVWLLGHTGAEVVLSSSWRTTPEGRDHARGQLARCGLGTFTSCTPDLGGAADRETEILQWADQGAAQGVTSWVVLDDANLDSGRLLGRFVRTAAQRGLMQGDAEAAARLLLDQCPAERRSSCCAVC
eukprot:TRINITY_DN62418_c0_g1_i1.p1 TRINITY_DN62418_c0_g1~~TRINITY_DN62418_c0_g1_i1.p1  ORF type:complete len:183 (+),score=54.47 TRINITY_DN62418_c0_g1_i1:63-551(+)